MKMLPVRRSKEPLTRICQAMTNNLRIKFKTSVAVDISYWNHDHITYGVGDEVKNQPIEYRIWLDSTRVHYKASSWQKLIDVYYQLMKGELL